jgi:hypothetical protein
MTLDQLDPENRRRVERLLRDRPRRLAALDQHAPRWPDTIAQLDAQNRDTEDTAELRAGHDAGLAARGALLDRAIRRIVAGRP